MKTCTKCQIEKPLSEFHNCKSKASGKFSACKVCRNAAAVNKLRAKGYDVHYAELKAKNPDLLERQRESYYRNIDKRREYQKRYREENIETVKERRRRDYRENRDRYIDQAGRWARNNRDRTAAANQAYYLRNKAEINRKQVEAQKKKYHDPRHKPAFIARSLIARMIRLGHNKKSKTEKELGYTFYQFRSHIERQFEPGMSWSNHGDWHVDHIIPVAEFMRNGVTCPKKINALRNLRPLWAEDNMKKGDGFDLVVAVAI